MPAVKITVTLDLTIEQRRALEKELHKEPQLISSEEASRWAESVLHEELSDVVWKRLHRPAKQAGLQYVEGVAR